MILFHPAESRDGEHFVLVNRGWVPDAYRRAMEACSSCDGAGGPGGTNTKSTSGGASSSWSLSSIFGGGGGGAETSSAENAVTLDCVVRQSEKRGRFVPENEPDSGQWYWVDQAALADHFNLDRATTLMVEAVDSFGEEGETSRAGAPSAAKKSMPYPEPRRFDSIATATSVPVEGHYMYAGIWGSLAIATQILASRARRGPGRSRI